MKSEIEKIKKDYKKHLQKRRSKRDQRWRDIAEYFMPDADILNSVKKEEREQIYDSTPEDANELLAAGLHAFLTPSQKFFNLRFVGEDNSGKERKDYLKRAEDMMMEVFSSEKSGFNLQVHQMFQKIGPFACGVIYSELKGSQIVFKEFPIWSCVLVPDSFGKVVKVYRSEKLSAENIIATFNKASEEVTNSMVDNPSQEFEVIHAVFPRKLSKKPTDEEKLKPYISIYFEAKSGYVLRESGYRTFPYQTPRWSVPSSVYGYGVGDKALPDTRTLNEIERDALIASEKQGDPPTYIPDDSLTSEHSSEGGAVNYYDPTRLKGGEIFQHPVNGDLNAYEIKLSQKRESIKRMFLNDKLQMIGGPQMTATEVIATQEEKMRVLGPVLNRFQTEFLAPLIERVYDLLLDSGKLEMMPGEDGTIKIEYVSPITQAQKQVEANKVIGAMGLVSQLAQVDPAIYDNFDLDEIARTTEEWFGYSSKFLKDKNDVKEIRDQRAQAESENKEKMQKSQELELAKQTKELVNAE